MNLYFEQLHSLLNDVEASELPKMTALAGKIADRLQAGGIIQLFGSGHSTLLAQDGHFRSGGLVPVKAIQIEPLMLHKGALLSSANEKQAGFLAQHQQDIQLEAADVCIIISTSAKNPAPLDMAYFAKEAGALTISLQSLAYTGMASNHVSGKRLEEVVDVVLDTHVPVGDGVLALDGLQYGPVSTVLGAAILNALYGAVIEELAARNIELPVFGSSNIQTTTTNESLIEHYGRRIHF